MKIDDGERHQFLERCSVSFWLPEICLAEYQDYKNANLIIQALYPFPLVISSGIFRFCLYTNTRTLFLSGKLILNLVSNQSSIDISTYPFFIHYFHRGFLRTAVQVIRFELFHALAFTILQSRPPE